MFRAIFALVLILIWSATAFAELKADPNAVFPVEKLTIHTSVAEFDFTVEIADEQAERSRGLMHREEMLPTHGMLFDFGRTKQVLMWMENTPRSLDMIFIKEDGIVAHIVQNTVPFSRDIISSRVEVSHVLELNAGISKQIGLKPGDRIEHRMFPALRREE